MAITEIFAGVGFCADALYILERAIQSRRDASSREWAALEAARSELEPVDRDVPVDRVDGKVGAILDGALPKAEARLLRRQLRAAGDVASRFVREARESSAYGRLPNYGVAIEHAAVTAAAHLAEWGCFAGWGEPCWLKAWDHQRPTDGPIRLLAAPEVTRVDAERAPGLEGARWFFLHHGDLPAQGVGLVDVAPMHGKDPALCVDRARFFARDGSNGTFLASLRATDYRRPKAPKPPQATERWAPAQMTAYFEAILADFLDHAQRTRAEIAHAEQHAAAALRRRP